MSTNQSIKKPGDVSIEEMVIVTRSGVSVDIYNSFLSMDLYESIYNFYLEGVISFMDTKNIKNLLPLVGDENLRISFSTPGKNVVTRTFSVRGMGSSFPTTTKNEMIHQLYITSRSYVIDMVTKVSRSYKNLERTKIIESIYNDYLYSLDTENILKLNVIPSTNGPTSIVIPYWNPFKAISKIANHCEYMNNCDYMFYETLDSVNFYPMSFLKKQQASASYFYPETATSTVGSSPDFTYELRKILNYAVAEQMNEKYDNVFKGMYSGTNLCFDSTYKKMTKSVYAYFKDFDDTDHIEKFPTLPRIRDEYSTNFLSSIYKTDTSSFLYDDLQSHNMIKNNMFKRNNHISHMSFQKMNINVYGDTDRRCGELVEVIIPSKEPISSPSQDKDDKYLSGKYMITSISHQITRKEHVISMDLSRDSLPQAIPDTSELT